MSTYKLTYFNLKGRAEIMRYLFALADQEYEDERIPWGGDEERKQWRENQRDGTLWGTLPELTVDGRRMCQTPAIARFLAAKFDLMGSSPEDAAYIDMIISCMEDVIMGVIAPIRRAPDEKKEEVRKEYQDKAREYLTRLTTFLVSSNNGEGWLCGDSVTVADVYVSHVLTFVARHYPEMWNDFPKLQGLVKRFEALPKIAAWIEKRPDTLF